MKAFIEYIAKNLVDDPDGVRVEEVAGDHTTVFELRVGEGELGKLIGREGKTARALRTLLAAVAARQGKRAILEILE